MPAKKDIQYRVTENGCWECTSHTTSDGYPVATINRKRVFLHRLAYEQKHGTIPAGMVVRHKCDNRKCINPEHLEVGTHQDNVNDRIGRNRSATGSRIGTSILTEEQAREIKNDKITPTRLLAAKYNVSKTTIRDIRNGRRWKQI